MPSHIARRSDPSALHPVVRAAVARVEARLKAEGFGFRLFEAFRAPERQASLYAQGRTAPGSIVTKARPWESYHQYGLAVDFVLFIDGNWSWRADGALARAWDRLHEIGREEGLEPLSWEKPHLQYRDTSLARLRAGDYPDGGDSSWADALREAIIGWDGGGAPPMPSAPPDRPPLAPEALEELAVEEPVFAVVSRPAVALREQPERGLTLAVLQGAQASQQVWGVPASVVLAQFIQESGGGKHMPPGSNNPFGIKAREDEPAVVAMTEEVINGKRVRVAARFRKFASFDEAFSQHGRLLATSRYYKAAMARRDDPVAFAHALTGIYATDPDYGNRLVRLMEQCGLREYDLVGVAPQPIAAPVFVSMPEPVAAPALALALSLGASGENVRALQRALVSAGYSLGDVDGEFGSLTRAALLGFQADVGLPLTGVADAVTVERLNRAPQRPLARSRMAATEADLVAKGSVTMKEARRTRLLGVVTGVLGALGIGNSMVVAGADATAPVMPSATEGLIAQVAAVLANPQARSDPAQLEALGQAAGAALRGVNTGVSPELARLAGQLLQVLPPEITARNPQLAQVLGGLARAISGGVPAPRTVLDLLPGMFADGSVLQIVANGAATVAASTVPGFAGSIAALGIGLAARYFGNKIAGRRLAEHREGSNLGL